jgi:oxygen-independent coproporphyrinogen-3 oxidase
MYLQGLARLDRAGYEQYEISNVARGSRRSRHNLKYWQAGSWLGLGCAAHSTWDGVRWRNHSVTGEHSPGCSREPRADVRRYPVRNSSRRRCLGLRLVEGLDLAAIRAVHGVDVLDRYGAELERFIDAGMVVALPGGRLALTRSGMLVANEIMMVFIGDAVR